MDLEISLSLIRVSLWRKSGLSLETDESCLGPNPRPVLRTSSSSKQQVNSSWRDAHLSSVSLLLAVNCLSMNVEAAPRFGTLWLRIKLGIISAIKLYRRWPLIATWAKIITSMAFLARESFLHWLTLAAIDPSIAASTTTLPQQRKRWKSFLRQSGRWPLRIG